MSFYPTLERNLMRLRYDRTHDVLRAGEFLRQARRLVAEGGDEPGRGGPKADHPGGG